MEGYGQEFINKRNDCTANQIDLNTNSDYDYATKEGKVTKTIPFSILKKTYMKEKKLVSYHSIGKFTQPKWYFECPH
jgi:hypothetical protein